MSRSVDSLRSTSLRVWLRKQFEAMRRRQSSYSLVSATLPALTAITLLIDIIGSKQQGDLGVLVLSLGFFAAALLVLVVGKTLPKWAGLILVTVITLVAVFATQNERPHDEVNALLIAPLVGLYLGWFHRTFLARLLGGALLLVLLIAGVQREPHSLGYSVFVAVGHAVAIAALCFEAAASLRRRLDRQAVLDPLTGVFNRRGLVEAARKAMAAARKQGTPLSLALIDLDDFKRVNDEGGHQAGDAALRETADSWVGGFGPRAVVARIGGDEFVLLVAGDSALVDAQLRVIRGRATYSWSWGLAQLRDEDTLRTLMKRADRRMYRAKDVRET